MKRACENCGKPEASEAVGLSCAIILACRRHQKWTFEYLHDSNGLNVINKRDLRRKSHAILQPLSI